MNVSTQTYTSKDKAIQVRPINLHTNKNDKINKETSLTYKYNSLVSNYHKKFNENGRSITQWGKKENVHKNVAQNTLYSFVKIGITPPNWLNRRAKRNIK